MYLKTVVGVDFLPKKIRTTTTVNYTLQTLKKKIFVFFKTNSKKYNKFSKRQWYKNCLYTVP